MKRNGLRGERLLNCHQEKIASWVHREAQDMYIYQSFLKVATRRLSNWRRVVGIYKVTIFQSLQN